MNSSQAQKQIEFLESQKEGIESKYNELWKKREPEQ